MLTCRMQPCEESGPPGITRLYRSETHNTRGQMTLATSRVQTQTPTFLRQSYDRSALFNLFYTNDQVRKIQPSVFYLGYILGLPGIYSRSTLYFSCTSLVVVV